MDTTAATGAAAATTAKRGRKPKAAAATAVAAEGADTGVAAAKAKAPRRAAAKPAKAAAAAGVPQVVAAAGLDGPLPIGSDEVVAAAGQQPASSQPDEHEHIIMQLHVTGRDAGGETLDAGEPNAYNQQPSDSFASRPFELDAPLAAAAVAPAVAAAVDASQPEPRPAAARSSSSAAAAAAAAPAAPGCCSSSSSAAAAPAAGKPRVVQLLRDFAEKNKNNEWPQTTHVACYWCCHRFDGQPFGVPVKHADGKFHVVGCFCSLECAAAHNFGGGGRESAEEVWERYHLINMLSRAVGHKAVVKCAPSRLALKMFGGHLSVEEFRAFCHTSKLISVNFPPMMALTQQLEEVNESDLNTNYSYVPLDTDRINKVKERIRLKRSKPITEVENTLEHTMALAFGKE